MTPCVSALDGLMSRRPLSGKARIVRGMARRVRESNDSREERYLALMLSRLKPPLRLVRPPERIPGAGMADFKLTTARRTIVVEITRAMQQQIAKSEEATAQLIDKAGEVLIASGLAVSVVLPWRGSTGSTREGRHHRGGLWLANRYGQPTHSDGVVAVPSRGRACAASAPLLLGSMSIKTLDWIVTLTRPYRK